jgi:hypothetical protein
LPSFGLAFLVNRPSGKKAGALVLTDLSAAANNRLPVYIPYEYCGADTVVGREVYKMAVDPNFGFHIVGSASCSGPTGTRSAAWVTRHLF